MNILLHEAVKNLPPLYSQEHMDDPIVSCRICHPFSDWLWYPLEADLNKGLFFGYVRGFEGELGYFSVSEFKDVEDTTEEPFEIDPSFTPMKLSEVKKLPNRQMPDEGMIVIYIV